MTRREYIKIHSAVSSPWDCSKRFTIHPWQTCSFQHHFDFSGKHPATLQLLREDIRSDFHLCMWPGRAYSFIQLSELLQRGMNEFAKTSRRQREYSNPGSLNWNFNVMMFSYLYLYSNRQGTRKLCRQCGNNC